MTPSEWSEPGVQETGKARQLADELAARDAPSDPSVTVTEQTVGRDLEQLGLEPEEVSNEHLLRTSGLLSNVDGPDGEELGHVLMLEWDDVDTPEHPVGTADRKPGINVLLRSSACSYHLYNLSVRPFAEQVRDAARETGDLGHVRWAARRGYFALRVLPKIRESDGSDYKPGPELIAVFSNPSELPQSWRHLRFFESIAEEQEDRELIGQLRDAEEEHELTGSSIRVDHYQTVTDAVKRAVGGRVPTQEVGE